MATLAGVAAAAGDSSRRRGGLQVSPLWLLLPPAALIGFLVLTGDHPVTVTASLCGYLLTLFPWGGYLFWQARGRSEPPIFALVSGAFWLYMVFPYFWGEHEVLMYGLFNQSLSGEAVDLTLFMATLGMGSLVLGQNSGLGRLRLPMRFGLRRASGSLSFARALLGLGIVFSLYGASPYVFGSGFRQVFIIAFDVVPLVLFAYFLQRVFRGEATLMDKLLTGAFAGMRFLSGMSGGSLGTTVGVFVVAGLVYLHERRKLPFRWVTLVFLLFLFLQASKGEFRNVYLQEEASAGRIEKMITWATSSARIWTDSLTGTGAPPKEIITSSLSRVSLLSQSANVLEMTPEVVPFQGLEMYRYLFVTFIPRFIWPDKPSVNEANQFYQVAYGMSLEEDVEHVSIAVGFLTESYIAFGWWGVVGVMFLVGVAYDAWAAFCFSPDSDPILQAIGTVIVASFIGIEGQMAQYFGGLVQQVVVTLLLLLPVLSISLAPRSRRALGNPWQETAQ